MFFSDRFLALTHTYEGQIQTYHHNGVHLKSCHRLKKGQCLFNFVVELVFKSSEEGLTTQEDAESACKSDGLVLASSPDARAGFELGQETCGCGWLADGSKVQLVQNPRENCSADKQFGMMDCTEEKALAICIDDRI